MTMTAREVFEKGTATFNAHDIDGFAKVLADDVVFRAPGGITGNGKEACAAFFGSWFAAFPDAHVDVHAAHFIGDIAVEEGTFTGTQTGILRGPMGVVAPTGRHVKVDYVQVLRFRDGKHVSFKLLFDQLTMFQQLGLVPASAAKPVADGAAAD